MALNKHKQMMTVVLERALSKHKRTLTALLKTVEQASR